MNVQIADINETRKTLTVTLDKGEVDTAYQAILSEFSKQVSLPGFRPGKAPAQLVVKRFAKEIREEFKGRVISKAYRDGLEESKLDVLALVDVEEGAVEPGLSAAIKLTVDVRPDFKLPEYKGSRHRGEGHGANSRGNRGCHSGPAFRACGFQDRRAPRPEGRLCEVRL